MPLDKTEEAVASRLFLEAVRNANEAVAGLKSIDDHLSARHIGPAKASAADVSRAIRTVNANMEDLRRHLGLEDPKEISKRELSDRYKELIGKHQRAVKQKDDMTAAGQSDVDILASINQVIDRHAGDMSRVRSELHKHGMTELEISALTSSVV